MDPLVSTTVAGLFSHGTPHNLGTALSPNRVYNGSPGAVRESEGCVQATALPVAGPGRRPGCLVTDELKPEVAWGRRVGVASGSGCLTAGASGRTSQDGDRFAGNQKLATQSSLWANTDP